MTVQESESMLTGDEVRRARQRAGWSQGELARRLGVAMRTVGNWERGDTSPAQKETVLRAALSGYMDDDLQESRTLRQSSDAELIAEIARRLERAQRPNSMDVGWTNLGPNSEIKTAGSDEHDDVEQDDYELAASHGDEGIGPDELPETT